MAPKAIAILGRREVRESLKNRWFILYTLGFSGLALAFSFLAFSELALVGAAGFGRTVASLINMVLLFVPLVALSTGAMSIAGERERGTLSYLLAQPVSRSEVFLGKFIGLGLAIFVSILLGFGLSGTISALRGISTPLDSYLSVMLLAMLLACAMLSVGLLVSVLSKSGAKAMGLAVFLWLTFLVLADVGIMGTAMVMRVGIKTLFWLALANPVEVFKIAALLSLSPHLEVLGPVGIYAVRTLGPEGVRLLLFLSLLLWSTLPLALALAFFTRPGEE